MKAEERDRRLLEYIRSSIDHVERYYRPNWDSFELEEMAADAILRRLETLSDAAAHLSERLRARHQEIAWPRIVGFRNVLAHGYLSIDPERIDDVLRHDLPPLKEVVNDELS